MSAFGGVVPVLLTPFHENDSVDFDVLERELRFLAALESEWIAFGFGSEVFRMSEPEIDQLLAYACRFDNRRFSVIGNVRAGSTAAAIERAKIAAASGAAAVMMPLPPFAATTPDDLIDVFVGVTEASGLPIVVQDAPAMTGFEMAIPTLLTACDRLGERLLALKIETPSSADKITCVLAELGSVRILGGNGGIDFLRELDRGVVGTMPSAAYPDLFDRILRGAGGDDRADAERSFAELLPLLTLAARDLDTFLFVEKEILRRRGVFTRAEGRRPFRPPSAQLRREVDALYARLEGLGMFPVVAL